MLSWPMRVFGMCIPDQPVRVCPGNIGSRQHRAFISTICKPRAGGCLLNITAPCATSSGVSAAPRAERCAPKRFGRSPRYRYVSLFFFVLFFVYSYNVLYFQRQGTCDSNCLSQSLEFGPDSATIHRVYIGIRLQLGAIHTIRAIHTARRPK